MNENKKALVLMVEDEEAVLRINARIMGRHGYEVLRAASCREAYELLECHNPDLLILDIMLPDGNGWEICEYFRGKSDSPVIFLSGKNEIDDRLRSLGKGGDYYLTKPYEMDELLAVSARLIERSKKQEAMSVFTRGSLVLDIQNARATVSGVDAGLTAKEFALLLALVRREDCEVSPQALYETVWGVPSVDDVRTVRTHVKNLRRKINADNEKEFDIVSAYGKGYMFTRLR